MAHEGTSGDFDLLPGEELLRTGDLLCALGGATAFIFEDDEIVWCVNALDPVIEVFLSCSLEDFLSCSLIDDRGEDNRGLLESTEENRVSVSLDFKE